MAVKRIYTVRVEQGDTARDDDAVKAAAADLAAALGGTVTGVSMVEHDVVVVEQETFTGQYTIEV